MCCRCGATLFARKPDGFQRAFALYLAALVLLILANVFPFLTLRVQGQVQTSHLLSGVVSLYRDGMWPVAGAVAMFVFAFPLAKILIGLLVVGPLAFGRRLPRAYAVYRIFDCLHPWAMTEIFLLGVLVSYTKLVGLATVVLGPSMFAYIGLMLALIAAETALDPSDIWQRLRAAPSAGLASRPPRRMPSDIEMLTDKAKAFLNRIEKAPIPELVNDLRKTVQEAQRLLASAPVQQGAQSLQEIGPLIESLRQTSETARLALDQATATLHSANGAVGPDSALRYDLGRMLKELTNTARSLRSLSTFLENNPNALIVGKPSPPGRP